MNEGFSQNMTGKTIKFDVQPYARGVGVTTKVTPRRVTSDQFMLPYGRVKITYECFDVEVEVQAGSSTGALWGGVPVAGTTRSLAGETYSLVGVRYEQLWEAVEKSVPVVIARCG